MTNKVVEIESGAKKKVRGRPFEPGNKLGRGRPKGSRNAERTIKVVFVSPAPPHGN